MIQANKGSVIADFHQTTLDIRYKELKYYLGVFNRMSGVSGLLAGFASTGLMMEVPSEQSEILVMSFLSVTGGAFGLNLLVILIATLCSLWAPGKALRGDDGLHLHQTVDILESFQTVMMWLFLIGVMLFFVASILLIWIFFDKTGAIIATGMLGAAMVVLLFQSLTIRGMFGTSQYATGRIRGNAIRSTQPQK
mmetsp:Transcript_30129/g.65111  ORF Transcript_30129/g.65111 Transcript_30129/m.65111 type:complete len:194 (-) Transcript_30129:87-668(-)